MAIFAHKTIPGSIEELKFFLGKELILYSKLKYGNIMAIKYFADILAVKLLKLLEKELYENCYLTSTLMTSVPSASHWLAKEVLMVTNRTLAEKKSQTIRYIDLPLSHRSLSFRDYSKLSKVERLNAQKSLPSMLCVSNMDSQSKIFIVNDINVTGLQLCRQTEIMKVAGFPVDNIIWLYIYNVDQNGGNVNTQLENYLNNFAFENEESFVAYLLVKENAKNTLITKRLILKVLTLSPKPFEYLLKYGDKQLLLHILDGAYVENMHLNLELSVRINMIRSRVL